jgi:hypothetical protein
MIFLIDTGIRRWEHVVGLWQLVPARRLGQP